MDIIDPAVYDSAPRKVQGCDAVQFINSMQLRDPRVSPTCFTQATCQVREAIWAWGPLPCDDDTFSFAQLDIHTDGSAVLGKGWPAIPLAAGWSVLLVCGTPVQDKEVSWLIMGAGDD